MPIQIDRRSFLTVAGLGLGYKFIESQLPVALAAETLPNEPKKCNITEIITEPHRIERDKFNAYFKVDTGNDGWFYIVQNKNSRTKNVFDLAYDKGEKKAGKLFPPTGDPSKPVAVISGNGGKLSGTFKIYDTGDGYSVKYEISPLINVPSHTTVDSRFLLDVDETIKGLPLGMVNDMVARGIEVYLAKNIEDSYYHLYPSWQAYDRQHPNDPSKPWLEMKDDGCIDHRNYSNTSALYTQKRVVIPQTHYEYGTRKLYDRVGDFSWTRHTVGHEIGHAVDNYNSNDYHLGMDSSKGRDKRKGNEDWYSQESDFLTAFEIDKQRMDPEIKKKVAYSWCRKSEIGGQVEGFANIISAFLGTESKDGAGLLFSAFPRSSEIVREKFLPKFGVKLTIADIREKIYPGYQKIAFEMPKKDKEKAALALLEIMTNSKPGTINSVLAEQSPPCCGR